MVGHGPTGYGYGQFGQRPGSQEGGLHDQILAFTIETRLAELCGLCGSEPYRNIFVMSEEIVQRLFRRIAEREEQEQEPCGKTPYDG